MKAVKMTKTAAQKTIREALERGMEWVEGQGYVWFAQTLVPAVRSLPWQNGKPPDRRLARDAFCLLGDAYDLFFDAPKAALRAYRRCVSIDRDCGHAWREIGSMLWSMGQDRQSKAALSRALKRDPGDEDATLLLKIVEENLARPCAPAYRAGDPPWEAAELLAQLRPRKALEVLKNRRTMVARQVRARAYAALGEDHAFVQEWTGISKGKGTLYLGLPDWFVLPEGAWGSSAFWRAILKTASRFEPFSCFLYGRDLSSSPRPDGWAYGSNFGKSLRQFRLIARLHLARTQNDVKAVEAICRKFPHWTKAAATLRSLRQGARPA
ncbi:MAG TPA: hypothetical protein VM243_00570 [Phycisphaerae bacterium]|nr:hypothetical protein [Phycisphaerae bacterium]